MPFDHFGALAPFYDRLLRVRDPGRLIELAGLPCNGLLLDAGGGTGRVTQALRELVRVAVIADESQDMLARAALKVGLHTVQTTIERLPFPDASFERIIMIDALHHMADQPRTADELWRVLKPGGRMVIEEPDIATLAVKLIALGEKLAGMRSHFLAPPHIAALFTGKKNPSARWKIEREGWNAWVIVEKDQA